MVSVRFGSQAHRDFIKDYRRQQKIYSPEKCLEELISFMKKVPKGEPIAEKIAMESIIRCDSRGGMLTNRRFFLDYLEAITETDNPGHNPGNPGNPETGKYLWKGKEYTHLPHQLEVDTGRGVLYLHNLLTGETILRVCQIPDDIIGMFEIGTVVIDLVHTSAKHGGKGSKTIQEPTFLNITGNSFVITNEGGQIFFEFKEVPAHLIKNLRLGDSVDITLGITGRTPKVALIGNSDG